ncbi:MAG: DNA cytosine methyltransferase [Pseudomonadota bacterium]
MYLNEIDQWCCSKLKSALPQADVDCADIRTVNRARVTSSRAHFFAGIGGWELALRMAGWPQTAPVWTGSCPCQPFSSAGRRKGTADERHLWPEFRRLIDECRPPVVFGEQVASPDGRAWLDTVCADLEALDFAVAAADLCAASIGAPHIRQRLYWVAIANGERREELRLHLQQWQPRQAVAEAARRGAVGGVADAASPGRSPEERASEAQLPTRLPIELRGQDRAGDPWFDPEWLDCADGTRRPTQPGVFPLANGIPERVGRLKDLGNAIVPQIAATFIEATLWELQSERR